MKVKVNQWRRVKWGWWGRKTHNHSRRNMKILIFNGAGHQLNQFHSIHWLKDKTNSQSIHFSPRAAGERKVEIDFLSLAAGYPPLVRHSQTQLLSASFINSFISFTLCWKAAQEGVGLFILFLCFVDCSSCLSSFRGAPWPATAHNRASKPTKEGNQPLTKQSAILPELLFGSLPPSSSTTPFQSICPF